MVKAILKPRIGSQKMPIDDSKIYQDKCIKQCLVPFLDVHPADEDYYVRPDLATSHRSKATVEMYRQEHVAYISSPPNCPQLRPIENTWGWLKSTPWV